MSFFRTYEFIEKSSLRVLNKCRWCGSQRSAAAPCTQLLISQRDFSYLSWDAFKNEAEGHRDDALKCHSDVIQRMFLADPSLHSTSFLAENSGKLNFCRVREQSSENAVEPPVRAAVVCGSGGSGRGGIESLLGERRRRATPHLRATQQPRASTSRRC